MLAKMNCLVVPPLVEGECHVWWVNPAAAQSDLAHLLSHIEQIQWSRFRRDDDRALYLVAHALARIVLAAQLGISPNAVSFSTVCQLCGGPHGKPRLQNQTESLELSISHSGRRAVVAVACGASIGVDVEQIVSRRDNASLIREVLTPSEQMALAQLPTIDRASAFLKYWTRKEALLKATGSGLAIAPTSVSVTGPTDAPKLVGWTAQPQLETPVHLPDLNPGPGHVACLAILGTNLDIVERDASDMLMRQ